MADSPLTTNVATQIGMVVDHIEEKVQAWSRLLGVTPPNILVTDTVEIAHTEYNGQATPARAKLAFFNLGQVQLELIEPLGQPSTWNDQLAANGTSLHHIAFEVKGMADRLATLAEHDLPLLQRGDYEGGRYAYLDGTKKYGLVVELLENDS